MAQRRFISGPGTVLSRESIFDNLIGPHPRTQLGAEQKPRLLNLPAMDDVMERIDPMEGLGVKSSPSTSTAGRVMDPNEVGPRPWNQPIVVGSPSLGNMTDVKPSVRRGRRLSGEPPEGTRRVQMGVNEAQQGLDEGEYDLGKIEEEREYPSARAKTEWGKELDEQYKGWIPAQRGTSKPDAETIRVNQGARADWPQEPGKRDDAYPEVPWGEERGQAFVDPQGGQLREKLKERNSFHVEEVKKAYAQDPGMGREALTQVSDEAEDFAKFALKTDPRAIKGLERDAPYMAKQLKSRMTYFAQNDLKREGASPLVKTLAEKVLSEVQQGDLTQAYFYHRAKGSQYKFLQGGGKGLAPAARVFWERGKAWAAGASPAEVQSITTKALESLESGPRARLGSLMGIGEGVAGGGMELLKKVGAVLARVPK